VVALSYLQNRFIWDMHAPQGSDLISMVRAKLCDKPIYDAVREADVTPENFIFKTNAQIYLSG
jgi:hypothetical protein